MSNDTCPVDECLDRRWGRKAYCRKHQDRLDRNGTLELKKPGPKPKERPCSVPGCAEQHKAHGYCRNHLAQARRDGTLDTARCTFPGCPHPAKLVDGGLCESHELQRKRGKELTPLRARDDRDGGCDGPGHAPGTTCGQLILARRLCGTHYMQSSTGKELTPIRVYQPKGGPCASTVCDREATVEGMCAVHRRYYLTDPETWDRPIKAKAPNGAGHTDKSGYRFVQHEGRQRGEHIVFAQQVLGRDLRTDLGENVHHKNGNRSDNRTDGPFRLTGDGKLLSGNLEVWSTAQPAGQEIGPKLDWAEELLLLYGATVDRPVEIAVAVLRAYAPERLA